MVAQANKGKRESGSIIECGYTLKLVSLHCFVHLHLCLLQTSFRPSSPAQCLAPAGLDKWLFVERMNEYVLSVGKWRRGGKLDPVPGLQPPLPSEGLKNRPSAPSPPGIQEPHRPPSMPPKVPGPPLPASQPLFTLLTLDQTPGFRGEGLGCNTEPSLLLHLPPRSASSLPATTVRDRPAAGKEERSAGGGGKTGAQRLGRAPGPGGAIPQGLDPPPHLCRSYLPGTDRPLLDLGPPTACRLHALPGHHARPGDCSQPSLPWRFSADHLPAPSSPLSYESDPPTHLLPSPRIRGCV